MRLIVELYFQNWQKKEKLILLKMQQFDRNLANNSYYQKQSREGQFDKADKGTRQLVFEKATWEKASYMKI